VTEIDVQEVKDMKRMFMIIAGSALLLYLVAAVAYAGEPSVTEILKHADRARGNVEGIIWDITITTNEDGKDTTRGLTVKVKGDDTLARYTSPPAYNDRMVLMLDRNMWFIRSGLKKPVSISPRQKLMGDAANGDIASTNYADDYRGVLAGEETVQGEPCYVLDLKAANKKVTYDRIRYWVSKERLVGVHAEFYTLSGKLFKTADFVYGNHITLTSGEEAPFISQLVIHDAIRKDKITTLTYANIRVEPIPGSTFNLNVLVR
jgi:outer membrane lipoprotein-sorting protein